MSFMLTSRRASVGQCAGTLASSLAPTSPMLLELKFSRLVTNALHLPSDPANSNLVPAQVKLSKRCALPQHPRQPPCALRVRIDSVAAQLQMSQRLVFPQHPCQPPCSLIVNL
eukprot:3132868-Rhodomonas_salina.1